jgi:hypothetical protein
MTDFEPIFTQVSLTENLDAARGPPAREAAARALLAACAGDLPVSAVG